jgi:hypothetical protein
MRYSFESAIPALARSFHYDSVEYFPFGHLATPTTYYVNIRLLLLIKAWSSQTVTIDLPLSPSAVTCNNHKEPHIDILVTCLQRVSVE